MKIGRSLIATLGALFLLIAVSLLSASWALDLSVKENAYTPLSEIETYKTKDYFTVPVTLDGNSAVDTIKSLENYPIAKPTNKVLESEKPVSLSETSFPAENGLVPAYRKVTKPLPTFVVFPVMTYKAHDKAFFDLPVLLSTAVANQLSRKAQQDGLEHAVINPVYAYDNLKKKGLSNLYQKLIQDYLEAGQPNEKDLIYLAEQLSTKDKEVKWIAFVHADFDMSQLSKPSGNREIPLSLLLDRSPKEPNLFLKSRVQIYSAEENISLLWDNELTGSMKMNEFGNFTRSVFDESDSALSFRLETSKLAGKIVSNIPKDFFTTLFSTEAVIVSDTTSPAYLSPQDQEALKRILQY